MLTIFLFILICVLLYWNIYKTDKTTPEAIFNEYIKQFSSKDYNKMLSLVSEEELKKYDYTKESFIKKYQNIYNGIEVSDIRVLSKHFTYDEEHDSYEGSFKTEMDTFIGEIQSTFTLSFIKEEKNEEDAWKIQWSPSLIFPEMGWEDKISAKTIIPTRGEIVDRNGIPLAQNTELYELGIIPSRLGEEKEKNIERISQFFHIPKENITKALNQKWVKPELFVPITTMPVDFKLDSVDLMDIPGASFQIKTIRYYPLKESAAHLIGYVRKVTKEDLEKDQNHVYSANDYIGKSGLEETFEELLRGKKGGSIQIIDEDGKLKKVLKEIEVKDGENITVTINSVLQNNFYQSLKNDVGSVSAMNPSTGELLALVSYPSFDPNLMVTGMTEEKWKEYSDNPNLPFLNRFTSVYAPGSTFKAITAAIGLTNGTTYPEKVRHISGLQWRKDNSWGGYYVTRVSDVTSVNMIDALAYSDNIYFAQEALEMGVKQFEKQALTFGFQEDFNLPIYLKKSQLSNKGIDSEVLLADSAYGQGQVLMSSIHLGVAFTPFANNGEMVLPTLIHDNEAPKTQQTISSNVANTVKSGLIQVVERKKGPAHNLKTSKAVLAAKTGTAELKNKKGEDGIENGFLVVFDTESPSILITAMIENVKGRGGSHYVSNKVQPILDQYLTFYK